VKEGAKERIGLIRSIIPEKGRDPAMSLAYLQPGEEGGAYLVGVGELASAGVVLDLPFEGRGIAIPGKHLGLLEGAREVRQDGVRLVVQRDDGTYTLSGIDGGEWRESVGLPAVWPEPPGEGRQALPEDAGGVIRRIAQNTSKDDYRGVFRGVQLEFSGGELVRVVASDGYSMALAERGDARILEDGKPAGSPVVVPNSVVATGLFGWAREAYPQPGGVWLFGEGFWAHVHLLEGTYPEYRRVIPSREGAATFTADPEEVLAAWGRVAPLANRQNWRVRLALEGGKVLLETDSLEGQAQTAFPVEGASNLRPGCSGGGDG